MGITKNIIQEQDWEGGYGITDECLTFETQTLRRMIVLGKYFLKSEEEEELQTSPRESISHLNEQTQKELETIRIESETERKHLSNQLRTYLKNMLIISAEGVKPIIKTLAKEIYVDENLCSFIDILVGKLIYMSIGQTTHRLINHEEIEIIHNISVFVQKIILSFMSNSSIPNTYNIQHLRQVGTAV